MNAFLVWSFWVWSRAVCVRVERVVTGYVSRGTEGIEELDTEVLRFVFMHEWTWVLHAS